jgi:hypothetical protein
MSRLGLVESFAKYGATLRNPQWSVSAWTPSGELVVSLWQHHYRKGPAGSMEFIGSVDRWQGPGNTEFRENIAKALASGAPVRLVIASTLETAKVEAGDDASALRKDFDCRQELVGQVIEFDGHDYVFRFAKR